MRHVDRALELLVGDDRPAHDEVLVNRSGEENRILEGETDMRAQGPQGDVAHVDAVQQHAAFADVVEARHKVGERGLAAAGPPDQANRLPGFDDEVEVAKDPLVGLRISKTDASELETPTTALEGARAVPVRYLGPGVEHFVEALGGRLALLAHGQDPADGIHRPDQHEDVVHERDKASDRHPARDHVHATQEQNGDERKVGQEVELRPELGARLDPGEARHSNLARFVFKALLHQRHAPERFDDAHAGCHLLDGGGHVPCEVLEAARDHAVLVVEHVAEEGDRHHAEHDHERQLPIELQHQGEDDNERDDGLQEPDQPEAHETADRADVGDRS